MALTHMQGASVAECLKYRWIGAVVPDQHHVFLYGIRRLFGSRVDEVLHERQWHWWRLSLAAVYSCFLQAIDLPDVSRTVEALNVTVRC